ncbi:MAG: hypothetical protein EXR50_05935 [Dehalococcoidia bacterium]|nr:hypothetical protein [Dehalococcoidia bacterium]
MADAALSVNGFLKRTRDRARLLVEITPQDASHVTPWCFIFVPQANGFATEVMTPMTVPYSHRRSLLTKQLRKYDPVACLLVSEAVTTTNLDAVKYGMETIPEDDQDEELMLVIVQRGRPPTLEMGKVSRTTTGRRLGPFREMTPEAAFFEEYLVLEW